MSVVVLLVALAIVGAVAVAAAAGAVQRNARRGQQLLPGSESGVPLSWAGAHSPEAKMHRRLTAAVNGLRDAAGGEPSVAENIVVVEHEAKRVEQQLLAASQVAPRLKDKAMEDLEPVVARIEEVAAELIGRSSQLAGSHAQEALRELTERLDLLDQARAELDDPHPGTA